MRQFLIIVCSSLLTFRLLSDQIPLPEGASLGPLPVGSSKLRIITPTILELTLITTKPSMQAKVEQWNFVGERGELHLPPPTEFAVTAEGTTIPVISVGFKRRVCYAPLKRRDLRIANQLYLQVAKPIAENTVVQVTNLSKKLWPAALAFTAKAEPFRYSPAIHVNQVGYLPNYSKKAMVGYFLGSLGEMELPSKAGSNQVSSNPATSSSFKLVEASSGKEVFSGSLTARPDVGFPFTAYQKVMEADFSSFKTPGEYRLGVAGLGVSVPFLIDEGVAGAFARADALGIYHQRCGTANELPLTRFTHGACHTGPVEVPEMSRKFDQVNHVLEQESANFKDNPRHSAPQLKSIAASLYPFGNKGPLDLRGGHHDAGDYSKYTINSASFIHFLIFAADVFPGVSELDNLGLPESGDGKSDVLQEAKWEADFLAKMQDADGGFYFLVYPRDRRYEDNVTPDRGDPQVVFPKTTSVTAAATAALAQCASSPAFKKQFPDSAAVYLDKAKKGWTFLQQAIQKFGKDGAYQKITHYGDEFMHDDELAWAACELFLATGAAEYQKKVAEWLNPADPATRRWGWWRLYDSYGNAIRSYAFAAKSGRLKKDQLQPLLLDQCEAEIASAGEEQLKRALNCSYGTSFPEETKRARSAGWYFPGDAAFDLAVACQLDYPAKKDPRPQMLDALLTNLNYEQGCNPVNVVYLTGLGWRRQREIVHQYAQNDRRILPLTGIPLGALQGGFGWLDLYQKELGDLSFPPDGSEDSPYPLYDRWGDSFNLQQEFVIPNQARALGYLCWLMAQTPLKTQPWKGASAQIATVPDKTNGKVTSTLTSPGLDMHSARIVWEAASHEPAFGSSFSFAPARLGSIWLEAEAQLPDGRRVFAATNFPFSSK